REDQRAHTRAGLVKSAHAVFLRRGFHGASLEEIALEAGLTKGAVYSNFDSKAGLSLAMLDARMAERGKRYQRSRYPARSLEHVAREHVRIMLRDDPDGRWSAVLVEAWVVAAGDPRFRTQLNERNRVMSRLIGELIGELAARSDVESPLPLH